RGKKNTVLMNFNDKKNKPLLVAEDETNFQKTTILDLKKKFKEKIPGAPGRLNSSYFYILNLNYPLEDNLTISYYKIKHLSVLLIVMKMPGGGRTSYNTDANYK
uniref:Ubiquitin-like domain-containing protein n=1 Tax=Sinocyclocheilus anshuiensis TaxID=1608454 RepID=A0A671PPL3_9TELE